jgi:hypothetical protein
MSCTLTVIVQNLYLRTDLACFLILVWLRIFPSNFSQLLNVMNLLKHNFVGSRTFRPVTFRPATFTPVAWKSPAMHWPECPNPFRPVAAVGKFSFSKSWAVLSLYIGLPCSFKTRVIRVVGWLYFTGLKVPWYWPECLPFRPVAGDWPECRWPERHWPECNTSFVSI